MNSSFLYKWTDCLGRFYIGFHKGRIDDGLTKETDKRVRKISETMKKTLGVVLQ